MAVAVITICSPLAFSGSSAAVGDMAVMSSAESRAVPLGELVRPRSCFHARRGLDYYRTVVLHWLERRGVVSAVFWEWPRTCVRARVLAERAKVKAIAHRHAFERWAERRRRERAALVRRLYEKWRCIHEHEGAWNDPNPPHWGGLQFDDDFQRTYGPEFYERWGTADHWPVYAQLIAAERAYRTRGFHPWPRTARACGLL